MSVEEAEAARRQARARSAGTIVRRSCPERAKYPALVRCLARIAPFPQRKASQTPMIVGAKGCEKPN